MNDITLNFAKAFAEEWVSSWNSHDINKILNHYADDFSIESRIASRLMPESRGKIQGKDKIKEYWTIGLSRNKNLEFKILDALFGINGLTIYYVNLDNNLRAVEMMIFNEEGKVQQVFVHHSE